MVRIVIMGLPLLLLISGSVLAQESSRTLNRFVIVRVDDERIEGHDGTLTATQLIGTDSQGTPISIPRADIKNLYSAEGSKAGEMALLCAGVGLAVSLAAILEVSLDKQSTLDKNTAIGFTIGFTAAGGIIGAIIGSSSINWREVPLKTSLWIDPQRKDKRLALSVSLDL